MTKEQIINNYLYFGYIPPQEYPDWANEIEQNTHDNYSLQGTIKVFDDIFDKLVQIFPDRKHIIPLSGGWDSRAILGALLERVDKNMVETVTFGAPGQLDYEIGIKVAGWAGVNHKAINLKKNILNWDKVVESINNSPWTGFPDCYYNSQIFNAFNENDIVVWSGFLGGLTGTRWDNNANYNDFINNHRRVKLNIINPDFNITESFRNIPYLSDNSNSNYDNMISYLIRQNSYILKLLFPFKVHSSKLVTPVLNIKNNHAMLPFTNKSWISFWLSAPHSLRLNQKLFLDMLNVKFPDLFKLPSKYSLGLPSNSQIRYNIKRFNIALALRIQKKAPWLGIRSTSHQNYLDYDIMFRTRQDYQEVLFTAFEYLKRNNHTPWIDFDNLWKNHMKKRKNYGNVFCLLIGLAANLQVNYQENEI